jgi:hypothetical protein
MTNIVPTDPKVLGVLIDETPAEDLHDLWHRLWKQEGFGRAERLWQEAVPFSVQNLNDVNDDYYRHARMAQESPLPDVGDTVFVRLGARKMRNTPPVPARVDKIGRTWVHLSEIDGGREWKMRKLTRRCVNYSDYFYSVTELPVDSIQVEEDE